MLWSESDASVSCCSGFRALRNDVGGINSLSTRPLHRKRDSGSGIVYTSCPRQQGRAGNPLPQAAAVNVAGELRDPSAC